MRGETNLVFACLQTDIVTKLEHASQSIMKDIDALFTQREVQDNHCGEVRLRSSPKNDCCCHSLDCKAPRGTTIHDGTSFASISDKYIGIAGNFVGSDDIGRGELGSAVDLCCVFFSNESSMSQPGDGFTEVS